MLTGDRVETGTTIAISAGLKSRQNELYFITDRGDSTEILQKLVDFKKKATNRILIIDGRTLDTILESSEATF